jgi:hypothetical protein
MTMRLAILALLIAACSQKAPPPATPPTPRVQIQARLDALHSIARTAAAAPHAHPGTPIRRAIARPTDTRDRDDFMLVNQEWIESAGFATNTAQVTVNWGTGLEDMDRLARGDKAATGRELIEAADALARIRWVAVVRVRDSGELRAAGEVLIFDAGTKDLLGGFPFEHTSHRDIIGIGTGAFGSDLDATLERAALAYASGR